MLLNIHRIDNNVGDIMSSPLKYFKFPQDSKTVDIMSINDQQVLEKDIIIGGGGLIAREFFAEKMSYIAEKRKGKLISWGIGHNSYEDLGNHLHYPKYMDKFDLHGIRDYSQGFNYIPCVSCMSELFDKKYETKYEFVVYKHANSQWKIPTEISNLPLMVNHKYSPKARKKSFFKKISFWHQQDEFQLEFSKIIKFLGQAETILTNTYHGMYWGILLNKKVLAFPFSTKFYTLKYKVPLCDLNNWQDKLQHIPTYPEALAECRDANKHFYQQVLAMLN